jgi:hypothetical protein
MEHAMQQKRRPIVEDVISTDLFEGEDELASAVGLRNAILLGAGVWAIILWSVFRFVL